MFDQRGRLNTSATTTASKSSVTDVGELYRVLYDFTAQNANEVSVKAGDIIAVTETADDGWFTMATNDSRKVILISSYKFLVKKTIIFSHCARSAAIFAMTLGHHDGSNIILLFYLERASARFLCGEIRRKR